LSTLTFYELTRVIYLCICTGEGMEELPVPGGKLLGTGKYHTHVSQYLS